MVSPPFRLHWFQLPVRDAGGKNSGQAATRRYDATRATNSIFASGSTVARMGVNVIAVDRGARAITLIPSQESPTADRS